MFKTTKRERLPCTRITLSSHDIFSLSAAFSSFLRLLPVFLMFFGFKIYFSMVSINNSKLLLLLWFVELFTVTTYWRWLTRWKYIYCCRKNLTSSCCCCCCCTGSNICKVSHFVNKFVEILTNIISAKFLILLTNLVKPLRTSYLQSDPSRNIKTIWK